MTKVLLWVPDVPGDRQSHVAQALRNFGLSGLWCAQPNSERCYQVKLEAEVPADLLPQLVSELAAVSNAFEVTSLEAPCEQYLFHIGLGIRRLDLSPAGQVLVPAEQVEEALSKAQGNLKEFQRQLRLIQGTAWLDLMDSYRHEESVRLLPFAV